MRDQHRRLTTWLVAAVLVTTIISVGYLAANPSVTTAAHTEFYLQGVDDNATTYPETVPPGNTTEFTVGISNHEHRAVTYRVVATVNGTETSERSVRVSNGEIRNVSVPATAPPDPGRYRIQFELYYDDGDTPDLTTWYWVQVRE